MIHNLRDKQAKRLKRRRRIRVRVSGTPECPRLSVFRSAKNTFAQVIDDESGRVIASASTLDKELRGALGGLKKAEAAGKVGTLLAERCLKKEIKRVVFDRNGYAYHGRVAQLATAAREKGLSV
ncbi:MAG TPA: 50S ribosomal protein L18 [Myxococcota bacterium]|nr:50S ribosomal protein L18 [Myxococcota bacterium]